MLKLYTTIEAQTHCALAALNNKANQLKAKSEQGDEGVSWVLIIGVAVAIAGVISAVAIAWVRTQLSKSLNGNG